MASKEIANEGFILTFTALGGWIPGVPVYTLIMASKAKAGGKKILLTQIAYNHPRPTPCSFAGHTFSAGAGVTLKTALKVKADGQFVMRKGDKGTCAGVFINNSSGSPVPCACNAEVTDAGQVKVKGN